MTRRQRIVFLLEHLPDVCGLSSTGTGQGDGDGPGFPLLTSMADHPSVIELGRCLRLLRRMCPNHARYLDAYYGAAWYVERTPKTVTKRGRRVRVLEPDGTQAYTLTRKRGLPGWLVRAPQDRETGEPVMVARGVDFISCAFHGDPFIPGQLAEVAGIGKAT